jgi:type IV pilus assembly protein PilB
VNREAQTISTPQLDRAAIGAVPAVQPQKRKLIGAVLCEQGAVSTADLDAALTEQRRSGLRLGEALMSLQTVSEEQVARALAEQWGYPYLDLTAHPPLPEAVAKVPVEVAERHRIVPVMLNGKTLLVATSDPSRYEAIHDVSFASGTPVQPVIGSPGAIRRAIDEHYRRRRSIEALVEESAREQRENTVQIAPTVLSDSGPREAVENVAAENVAAEKIAVETRAAPIVRLVDQLLRTALTLRASDLHLEPGPDGCRLRYRIDGLLCDEQRLPRHVQAQVISRLKVLARVDIAERRLPQDGSFRIRVEGREIDLRLSVIPVPYGEKIVVRVLDQSAGLVDLDALGCTEERLEQLRGVLRRTRGMILVTGPTGSGKTTTLYAMVRTLNEPVRNIVTVEDPIEYHLSGVNQLQVNADIGLTFARALRALLRQDPDIILVGEIRDGETAEIGCRAAMTGHLVLSTLHTNDAPSSVTRLLDLGVPRYLVASQLIGVIAQRLVRTICSHCRREAEPPPELITALRLSTDSVRTRQTYAGRGCSHCRNQGYWGRTAIHEVLLLTPPLRELIAAGASEGALRVAALSAGMMSLRNDGLAKVWQGITTLDEVARVIAADEACEGFCSVCLTTLQPDFHCCPGCGTGLQRQCSGCHRRVQSDWRYCPQCRELLTG